MTVLLRIFCSLLMLLMTGWISSASAAKPGDRQAYELVELDPPAVVEISPVVDGPLLRAAPMQFSVRMTGVPKPIHMWSFRVDYTTSTLEFKSTYTGGDDNQTIIAVSDPIYVEKGWISRNVAGVSLSGWNDGELIRLTFDVKGDAPETGSIRLGKHLFAREGLAHDSAADWRTYDYAHLFQFAKTTGMKVEDVSADRQPYVFETPKPRVLFSRDQGDGSSTAPPAAPSQAP